MVEGGSTGQGDLHQTHLPEGAEVEAGIGVIAVVVRTTDEIEIGPGMVVVEAGITEIDPATDLGVLALQ